MSDSWLWMSAADLGRGIGAGEIDPVALTQHYLAAAESHEYGDRIYARITADRALREAQAAKLRAAAGERLGPLDGVPVSWKDLFDSAGTETEAGSALLKGRVPESDCAVLTRAAAAGLICLGKTHMSELAFSGLGYNPVTATSPCVNDIDAVAGGSSSGAAASVAFGLAPAAIGSDTGGSVRVPAAWNDLVGLKTTSGLISNDGVVPLAPRFDTVGPLTRSVEDAALLLPILTGHATHGFPDPSDATLSGLRIGVLETVALDDLRDAPARGFDQARARIEAAGARVTAFGASCVSRAMELAGVLYTSEAYAVWGERIEALPDLMFERVRERFRAGRDYLATDYIRAWRLLDELRAEWLDITAGFDAIILPTVPTLPPAVDRIAADGELFVAENLLSLRNTRIGNLMGLCALTLPTGTPSAGISVLAPPMDEDRLLRLGAAIESAMA